MTLTRERIAEIRERCEAAEDRIFSLLHLEAVQALGYFASSLATDCTDLLAAYTALQETWNDQCKTMADIIDVLQVPRLTTERQPECPIWLAEEAMRVIAELDAENAELRSENETLERRLEQREDERG